MLDGSNPPRIKVCDFGFSKNWEDDVNMFTQVGAALQGGEKWASGGQAAARCRACSADAAGPLTAAVVS